MSSETIEKIEQKHRDAYEESCKIRDQIRTLMLELYECEKIVFKVLYGVDLSWEEFKIREGWK